MNRAAVLLLTLGCSTPTTNLYSIDPEAIRKACAMEVSCFANPPIQPAGNCVFQFEVGLSDGSGIFLGPSAADISRYVGCTSSANNCTDALNCASRNHGPDWCNAHPQGGCDGDSFIFCAGGWGLEITDCAALGMHCQSANGVAQCTDGNTCSGTTHCDGNRLVECNNATLLESSFDCGHFRPGLICKSDAFNSGSCSPPASASCTSDGATCQGTTAVVCSGGGQSQVSCGRFASHCELDGLGGYRCAPDATACDAGTLDSCSGSSLQICVNGNLELTPCSSLGLTTCQTVNGVARCQ
jgi:hypothetical protein